MLNADAGDLVRREGAKFIQILWDSASYKMALRPLTRRTESSYKLSAKSGRRGMFFSGTAFLRHVGWKLSQSSTVLAVKWNENEKLLEVLLPLDHFEVDVEKRR